VAFKLIPQGGPTLLAKPYSLIAKRGLFATKHLWVTPHKEEERYAAGDWVLQAEGGAGLEEWTKQVLQTYGALLRTDATLHPPPSPGFGFPILIPPHCLAYHSSGPLHTPPHWTRFLLHPIFVPPCTDAATLLVFPETCSRCIKYMHQCWRLAYLSCDGQLWWHGLEDALLTKRNKHNKFSQKLETAIFGVTGPLCRSWQ